MEKQWENEQQGENYGGGFDTAPIAFRPVDTEGIILL